MSMKTLTDALRVRGTGSNVAENLTSQLIKLLEAITQFLYGHSIDFCEMGLILKRFNVRVNPESAVW